MATTWGYHKIQPVIHSLSEVLRSPSTSEVDKVASVKQYIQSVENDSRFTVPGGIEFTSGLTWFNVDNELTFGNQLKGKLVVLDFFTYCCINCLHIMPDLHSLEERYPPTHGLVIIGVHSAKFPNEKGTDNLRNAIAKYNINHPVVNDLQLALWERLSISCWPTLVFIGPKGNLLYYIIGEGHANEMNTFTQAALEYYKEKGSLNFDPIAISPEKNNIGNESGRDQLSFPGKSAASDTHLYISDTGNHRVIVMDRSTGIVERVYGNGSPGLRDGKGNNAQFRSPQGIVHDDNSLYIADTENHCIRQIDLVTDEVTTVLGTGRQGNDKEGGAKGTEQEISSPWDLILIDGPEREKILCIANAGTHQIWAYFIEDSKWFKNSQYSRGSAVRLSGSGDEANRNNTFPHKASFAQPSGLAMDHKTKTLYVADSESSTIRAVSTTNGSVKGVIGGGLDPMDLFAFGDEDGKGRNVRLQHPLGVSWDPINSVLYIADSYNHKIKVCNPVDKTCHALAGCGVAGLKNVLNDGSSLLDAQFSEPGGVCICDKGNTLFVSDSNNHCIRMIDLQSKVVEKVDIIFQSLEDKVIESTDAPPTSIIGAKASHVTHPHTVNTTGSLRVKISLNEGYNLSTDQDSMWQISLQSEVSTPSLSKGSINADTGIVNIELPSSRQEGVRNLKVELLLFFCSADGGACHMHQALFTIPVIMSTSCDLAKGSCDLAEQGGDPHTVPYHVTINNPS